MHIAGLARWTGRAAAIAGCVALAGLATPAFAQDPPGNNGTVKIDNVAFDDHPDNEPHVGCVFQVDFYGFDAGGLQANVNFTGQAPTGKDISIVDDTVTLQDDPAGGGTDLDARATYDLSSVIGDLGAPHPEQGYHLKLTVDVPAGSQATAYSKFKVFWVEQCVTPTPTPTPTPTTAKPTPPPTHPPTHKPTPPIKSETPAPVPTAVPGGANGAGGSGAGLVGLVLAGGAVAGTAAIARRRFLHDS